MIGTTGGVGEAAPEIVLAKGQKISGANQMTGPAAVIQT